MAAAWAKTVESYLNWQGTFSAIFLMALQPAVFSEKLYFLTTFIMLAAVVAGCFAFCRAFFSGVLGLDKHLGGIAAALLCLLYTQLLPSPVQGLYWFNGSVYYVLFHGLLLLALALGIGLVKKGGLWRMALLCLLAVLIGGGNYVTALTAGILWAFAEMALIYIYIYISVMNPAAAGNGFSCRGCCCLPLSVSACLPRATPCGRHPSFKAAARLRPYF